MEHYEIVTEPIKKLVKKTCDICGNELKEYYTENGIDYANVVEMSHEKSEFKYEASGKYMELDICGDCFEGKILPFLRSIGLKRDYNQ